MPCTPHSTPEDLNILIREGIAKLCPPGLVPSIYDDIKFCLASGEPGPNGHYLLVGLQTAKGAHMRLREVLLSQPNFALDSPVIHLPWLEPPFLPPTTSLDLETPRDQRTAQEVADFLKSRFRPSTFYGKKARELRLVTTCLTTDPTKDSASKYAE